MTNGNKFAVTKPWPTILPPTLLCCRLLHEAQEQHQQQLQPMHARAQAGSAPGQVPAYLSEQFIKSLSSVVLVSALG